MNAMELITSGANDFQFQNKNLQNATMKIVRLTEQAKLSMFQIAFIVSQVDATECYKDDGFNSVHEWTTKVLGYRKSMSYDLLKIGRDYTREVLSKSGKVTGYECNLLPESSKDNFSTTQVIRMLPAGRELVCELVEDELIVPSMTGKQIADVIKSHTQEDEAPDDEPDETTETTDTKESSANDFLKEVSTDDLIEEIKRRGFFVYDSEMKVR